MAGGRGVHTPCVNGCHFSGVCFFGALYFFVCLTMLYREATQLV